MNCRECSLRFTLIRQNNRNLCFSSHQIQNCLETNFKHLENEKLNLKCLKCTEFFKKKTLTVSNRLCFPLRALPNCKRLDPVTSKCALCDDLFFLDESSAACLRRRNLLLANCRQFNRRQDECAKCAQHFSLQNGECVPSVYESIPNCLVQLKAAKQCLICDSGYFVFGLSECRKVTQEVSDCSHYDSGQKCDFCNKGYHLREQQCEEIRGGAVEGVSARTLRLLNSGQPVRLETPRDPKESSKKTTSQNKSTQIRNGLVSTENDLKLDRKSKEEEKKSISTESKETPQANAHLINSFQSRRLMQNSDKNGNIVENQNIDIANREFIKDKQASLTQEQPNKSILDSIENRTEQSGSDSTGKGKKSRSDAVISSNQMDENIKSLQKNLKSMINEKTPEEVSQIEKQLEAMQPNDLFGRTPSSQRETLGDRNGANWQGRSHFEEAHTLDSRSGLISQKKITEKPNYIFDHAQVVYPKLRQRFSSSVSQKPSICGLCQPMYGFSLKSAKCTHFGEKGCLVPNRNSSTSAISLKNPCLVCAPGYFQMDDGICFKNPPNFQFLFRFFKLIFLVSFLLFHN